jgi:hypothetical protein
MERAKALSQRFQQLNFRGPFMGLIKDIDSNLLPLTAANDLLNLRARPNPAGDGEVLMLAPGFARIDSTNLPLDTGDPVQMLHQFYRTDASGDQSGDKTITLLAMTSGDGGGTATAKLYRHKPTATVGWEEIEPTDGSSYDTSDDNLDHAITNSDIPAMPIAVDAPIGISEPNGIGGLSGKYGPVCIICTPSNEVMVYPAGNTSPEDNEYITLDQISATAGAPSDPFGAFQAISCAYWNGRVYFLNTSETGVRYRQRVRRSEFGSCNIDPANTGAGAFEIREFNRNGLRLLPLDHVLVAYFEDGTAFISRTGIASQPDQYTIVSRQRGIMSSHSVCDVGNNRHFVVAQDGWYWLDANGRWTEIGLTEVQGVPLNKWQRFFYENMDKDNRHRLQCFYIKDFNQVAVVYPKVGDDVSSNGTQEVWIYDIDSDRVWIDRYPVNVFGAFDATVRGSLSYTEAGSATAKEGYEDFTFPLTYDNAGAMSYAFAAGAFGLEQMIHGDNSGLVMLHDSQTFTRDTAEITWRFEIGLRQQQSSRYQITADRAQVEYIHAGAAANDGVGTFFCNASLATQSANLDMNRGNADEIHQAKAFYRFTSTSVGFRVTGTGPLMIRSFDLDVWSDQIEGDRD